MFCFLFFFIHLFVEIKVCPFKLIILYNANFQVIVNKFLSFDKIYVLT